MRREKNILKKRHFKANGILFGNYFPVFCFVFLNYGTNNILTILIEKIFSFRPANYNICPCLCPWITGTCPLIIYYVFSLLQDSHHFIIPFFLFIATLHSFLVFTHRPFPFNFFNPGFMIIWSLVYFAALLQKGWTYLHCHQQNGRHWCYCRHWIWLLKTSFSGAWVAQ